MVTLLFALVVFTIVLFSCSGIFRDDGALKRFTEDIIAEKCRNDEGCGVLYKHYSESSKLVNFYESIKKVNEFISEDPSWALEEGGSLGYHKKSSVLSLLADDKRVKTMCEIGFNSGHSATNFLSANPTASLISFDMFEKSYSSSAIDSVNKVFPNRTIITIKGDSTITIPEFIGNLSLSNEIKFKQSEHEHISLRTDRSVAASYPLCNLIFVDGGHTEEVFRADVLNMRRLADPEYHIVIVDDYEYPQISGVVSNLQNDGLLVNVTVHDDISQHVYVDYEYDSRLAHWKFIVSDDVVFANTAIATFQYNL